jgi:hypothetical protein
LAIIDPSEPQHLRVKQKTNSTRVVDDHKPNREFIITLKKRILKAGGPHVLGEELPHRCFSLELLPLLHPAANRGSVVVWMVDVWLDSSVKSRRTEQKMEAQQFDREAAVRQFLAQNMWPTGLQNALLQSIHKFPVRFMIVDDSGLRCWSDLSSRFVGSMMANDGHLILQHQGKFV